MVVVVDEGEGGRKLEADTNWEYVLSVVVSDGDDGASADTSTLHV